jgi:hypothetical protein
MPDAADERLECDHRKCAGGYNESKVPHSSVSFIKATHEAQSLLIMRHSIGPLIQQTGMNLISRKATY